MKTNKFVTAILSFSTLMGLYNCYDLDQYPSDSKSANLFYRNNEEAKEGIMGVYEQMKAEGTFGDCFVLDCLSDIAWGSGFPGYQPILTGTYTDRDGHITAYWIHNYQGIMLANKAIQGISSSTGISEKIKTETIGEAKFMRALYYFNLLDKFGGVPIYDESIDASVKYNEMKKPRSSSEEVRDFILSDLTEAIESLPVKWERKDYGRATKGAALSLRGKVYLFNKQYKKADDDFKKVVESGEYALYPNYADLFTPKADSSNEMIFAIQNSGGIGKPYGMPMAWRLGTNSTYGYGWNNSMPTNELAEMYETKEGKPFNWDNYINNFTSDDKVKKETFLAKLTKDLKQVEIYPKNLDKLKEMYADRDPRLSQTIILPYTKYVGFAGGENKECEYVIANGVNTINGFLRPDRGRKAYVWRKFVPVGNMDGVNPNRQHTPINFPLIRYADVLLMLAECENELGNESKAIEYINLVRQRPSTNMPKLNSGPAWLNVSGKDEVLKRIIHERAVEFAGEGLRFSDLRRWGLLETLNDVKIYDVLGGKPILKRTIRQRDYLWPIPAAELDNYKLKQNPGW